MLIKKLIATLFASFSLVVTVVAFAGLLFRYQNALASFCNWIFFSNYGAILGACLFIVALAFKMSFEDDCKRIAKANAPKVQPMAPIADPATTSYIPKQPWAKVCKESANAKLN